MKKNYAKFLINLINNAIKFTEKGSVILRVGQQNNQHNSQDTKTAIINFAVQDTGKGIAKEELDNLFKPFVQTKTGKKSAEGTGLGLAISHKFIQLMGGEITVDSEVNKGTSFSFNIPVKLANNTNSINQKVKSQIIGLKTNQPPYRILVVDDVVENRQLLQRLLASIGLETQTAENGQQAVDIWETWQPELIWMDLQMPVMNGYQAVKEIRKKEQEKNTSVNSANKTTKIIAITASIFDDEEVKVYQVGCDDIVRKPFTKDIIFDKMKYHLGIDFLYDNSAPEVDSKKPIVNLSGEVTESELRAELALMSSEWINKLSQAANKGSDEEILELIKQISSNQVNLQNILTNWANNFQFDQIIQLIDR